MSTSAIAIRPTPNHTTALGLLLGWVVFTAAWLTLIASVPSLQTGGLSSIVVRFFIQGTILIGLWLALARSGFDARTRVLVWAALAVPYIVWQATVWTLAVRGAFVFAPGIPAIPLAVFLPLILFIWPLMRSKRVGALLDAMPAQWLIALQAYRVFGGVFLLAWARGTLSGTFALPAGFGDILVGLLALPIAYYVYAGARNARTLAIGWNILGVLDLVNAVGIGILSAPGPLQLIIPDVPNALVGTYPTVMIPAFAVPSSIIFHALSLRQIARMRHA